MSISISHFNFITFVFLLKVCFGINVDSLGYILYCPCMGRFGNQADHFLGALSFAHGLNRTLVLPPWVEYRYGESRSIQVPFKVYFQVEPLQEYHRVVTMEEFMRDVAPEVWPENARTAFCYTSRGNGDSCNAKEGNPFGPFWDTYSIDFVKSEYYGPLHYDVHHHNMAQQWNSQYPPHQWPVLAFTGAPASFPVQFENRILQKYLKWSSDIEHEADEFIETTLPKGAFIGIHLRNGIDWVRACSHIPQSPNLFAAPQCLGYRNDKGQATMEMCLPKKETIIRQLKRIIKNYNGHSDKNKAIRSVFVASDNNHMIDELSDGLRRMNVSVYKYKENRPHVDLAILANSSFVFTNIEDRETFWVARYFARSPFERFNFVKLAHALFSCDTSKVGNALTTKRTSTQTFL